jgi:toxin ParE1/3/4
MCQQGQQQVWSASSKCIPGRTQRIGRTGHQGVRRIFFKPYRLIYRISAYQVTIYLVVDGRRQQSVLAKRLLVA